MANIEYYIKDEAIHVVLPEDFARLASMSGVGYKRSVLQVYEQGGEQYAIQHNAYTRAGMNKPVAVFVSTSELECFPAALLREFAYIRNAKAPEDAPVILKEELFDALCYLCASLVYDIFQQPETAEKLKASALSMVK